MSDWRYLEQIIQGNWRPHLINNTSEELKRLFKLSWGYKEHFSINDLGDLIDLTFPAPFNTKTEYYFWVIKLDIRLLTEGIKKLGNKISDRDKLQNIIINQINYAYSLKEEARTYQLRLDENRNAIYTNENCYIAACCQAYLELMLEEIIDYYEHLIPDHLIIRQFGSKLQKLKETEGKLEALSKGNKTEATETFALLMPRENQNEYLLKLFDLLKKSKFLEGNFPSFERHFESNKMPFQKLIWRKNVPLLKHTFLFLIQKQVIQEPKTNLDTLLSQHFLNKNGDDISENYLSQSLSRLPYDSDVVKLLHADLQNLISNKTSNLV